MRFLITAQPDPNQPRPANLDPELFVAHMKFNEEMYQAGVLLASEGLNPRGRGAHVVLKGGKRVVRDGPFAEAKELIGGFYLIEVLTLEDALSWAERVPVGFGSDDVLEVRPLTSASDIPAEFLETIARVAPGFSTLFTRPAQLR